MYWLGFEDVDYGLRAWRNGVRCYYQPAAMLVHHESASRGNIQGYRELASMRTFWRRWEHQLLARSIPADAPIDFVVGTGAIPLWADYVELLAEGLRDRGRDVVVHRSTEEHRDETLIGRLSSRGGMIIACDWTVAESVWLATAGSGVPAYLLPSMESAGHPTDAALQATIVAGYRSEFDYIAPNRMVQSQLKAETAWEARARIPPALRPAPLESETAEIVVTVDASEIEFAAVAAVARGFGLGVTGFRNVVDAESIERLAALRPRAVVCFTRHTSSLAPFALMSIGAAYLAPSDRVLSHEVLDGYNALLFPPGDLESLVSSLTDLLSHASIRDELRANGHASALRAASVAPAELDRALASFASVVA